VPYVTPWLSAYINNIIMPFTGVFFIETLGALYTDVQVQKIFPDSKYFVD